MTAVPGFWHVCPAAVREDPAVTAIADYVADPSVRARLRADQQRGAYPDHVLAELRARGLARLFGREATAWHLSALHAELAAADGSLAITVGVNSLALLPVHLDGSPELQARVFAQVERGELAAMLLTEWEHGSDLLANETRAHPHEGGHLLRGAKALINGGERHRLLTVLARTRERAPYAPGNAAFADHTLFWLERDAAVEAVERHPTLSARGADISRVELRGALASPGSVIGIEGDGFAVVRRTLALSRGGIAALAAGATAAVHAQARAHARSRVLYGKPIGELDAIADHLAELAELDAQCSAIAARATAFANAFGPEAAPITAAAKLVAPRLAERATDVARRVLGSRALLEDHDLARFIRDVPLYGIFDGTQHVMLEELSFGLERFARGRRLDASAPIERVQEAWRATPRPLCELGRARSRLRPIDPRQLARELSLRASHAWAASLPVLADAIFEVRERLMTAELWSQQATRFALAEALAWLDACFACLEVGDPRIAAELRGVEMPDRAGQLEAGGCRRALAIAGRLRALAAAAGWRSTALDDVEADLLGRAFRARRASIAG